MPVPVGLTSNIARKVLQIQKPNEPRTTADNVFVVQFDIENAERLEEILNMGADFELGAKNLFINTVFDVHRYLIRLTPLDTGELRGGWTSILLKYNEDFSIQLQDTSLYEVWKQQNKTIKGREYHFSQSDFDKGQAESFFEDLPFDITIINNVPQGVFMEFGTSKVQGRHTTELARYKGELWFNGRFEEWFQQIASEEKIVPPILEKKDIPV